MSASHLSFGIPFQQLWPLDCMACVLVCRFRRLAMKHHPDIEPAESSKEEFRRVCEAYEVLSSGEYQPDVEWCGMHGFIHISTKSLVLAADNSSKLLAAAVSDNQASRCAYWIVVAVVEKQVWVLGAVSMTCLGSPANASLGDVAALFSVLQPSSRAPMTCTVKKCSKAQQKVCMGIMHERIFQLHIMRLHHVLQQHVGPHCSMSLQMPHRSWQPTAAYEKGRSVIAPAIVPLD